MSIEELPEELICAILSYSGYTGVDRLQQTCSHFFYMFYQDAQQLQSQEKWTYEHQSYRAWFLLCLNTDEHATTQRMTRYHSDINPKLFYLNKMYEWYLSRLREGHCFIQYTEDHILQKFQSLSRSSTKAKLQRIKRPEVVLLHTDLIDVYIGIVLIQRRLGIQGMNDDSFDWFVKIHQAKKNCRIDKKSARLLSKPSSIILLYYINTEATERPDFGAVLSSAVSQIDDDHQCRVKLVRLPRSLKSLQSGNEYISMHGMPIRRNILAALLCGELL